MAIVPDLSGNNPESVPPSDAEIAFPFPNPNNPFVQGIYAQDSLLSPRPVIIGGRFKGTPDLLVEGGLGALALTSRGAVSARLTDGGLTAIGTGTFGQDTVGTATVALCAQALNMLFNGTTVERGRSVLGAPTGTFAHDNPLFLASDLAAVRINTAAAGDTTLVAAVASQTTRVHALRLSALLSNTVQVKDGVGTILEVFVIPAGGSVKLDFRSRPYYKTTTNTALIINLSAATQVDGRIEYITSV